MTALLRVRIIPSCLKRISKGPAALLYLAPLLTRVAIAIRSRAFTMDTREATEKNEDMFFDTYSRSLEARVKRKSKKKERNREDESNHYKRIVKLTPYTAIHNMFRKKKKVKGYNRTTVETTMYPVEHSKFYSLTPSRLKQLSSYTDTQRLLQASNNNN
eukprot:gene1067-637_t